MPRQYAAELRRRVIDLIEEGRSVREVATMVDPTEATIYAWWNQHLVDGLRWRPNLALPSRRRHARSGLAICVAPVYQWRLRGMFTPS